MATKLILDSGWSKGLRIMGPWIVLGISVTFPVQCIALNQNRSTARGRREAPASLLHKLQCYIYLIYICQFTYYSYKDSSQLQDPTWALALIATKNTLWYLKKRQKKKHAFSVRKAEENVRDEGPGIAAKGYSYCIWCSQEMHQAEGLKENFVSSKKKFLKGKVGKS